MTDQTTATTDQHLVIRGLRVAPLGHREYGDPPGHRPDRRQGRGPRDHGPQRLRQDDPRLRADGPPGLHGHGRRGHLEGPRHPQADARQARPAGPVPRVPVPDRDPGPVASRRFIRSALNAKLQGIDKDADIDPTDPVTRRRSRCATSATKMREKMALLRMDESFATRYVNEGFSGGEKKRLEMLQMAVLEPEMAILDETDSGLDIDALRIVAEGVNAMLNPNLGVLLITHYQRLLNYIKPDVVHVLAQGRIVKSGGRELALQLEEEGYGPILREAGLEIDRAGRGAPGAARPGPRRRRRARAGGGRPLAGARWPSRRPLPDPRSTRSRCGRLPDPRPGDQRPSAGLSRLGVEQPEAARRDRCRRRLLPRVQRQRPSRHLHDRREGDRGVRAGPRHGRAVHQRAGQPRDRVHPQRDRGDQPRGVRVGAAQHRRGATRSS